MQNYYKYLLYTLWKYTHAGNPTGTNYKVIKCQESDKIFIYKVNLVCVRVCVWNTLRRSDKSYKERLDIKWHWYNRPNAGSTYSRREIILLSTAGTVNPTWKQRLLICTSMSNPSDMAHSWTFYNLYRIPPQRHRLCWLLSTDQLHAGLTVYLRLTYTITQTDSTNRGSSVQSNHTKVTSVIQQPPN